MTQWGLDALFNPAKRHMDEEKRRLQSTREEIGDSSGGKRIDLESGKVTIRRSSRVAAGADAAAADSSDGDAVGADSTTDTTTTAATATASDAATEHDGPAPSPAAVRAARRRGRQPR
jgi:hypothetical protein